MPISLSAMINSATAHFKVTRSCLMLFGYFRTR